MGVKIKSDLNGSVEKNEYIRHIIREKCGKKPSITRAAHVPFV